MVFTDPYWPLILYSTLSYLFILEKPHVDTEVQLFFKAPFDLLREAFSHQSIEMLP